MVVTLHAVPNSLTSKTDCCEEPRVDLNQLSDRTDKLSIPLQDEDFSGNNPHSVPSFLRLCSKMFPEGFRNVSVPVGLRDFRLV